MDSSESSLIPVKATSQFRETLNDVISSAIGSACCVYTGQPFDTIKVRMQLLSGEKGRVNIAGIFKDTVNQGGVRALWRGSTPAFTGQLLENGVAFATNGFLKRLTSSLEADGEKSFLKPIITGGITGICSSIVLCPWDTVKCRAQAQIVAGGKFNVTGIIKSVVARDGVLGLWRGYGAQVLRDIPFYASFFGSYDILCHVFKNSTDWAEPTVYFVSGGLAGQIGWICSIGPDTIKSRIQVSDSPLTIRGVFKEVIRTKGLYGLFAGIEVAIVRAFPANAALFMGYEYSKKFLSSL